MAQQISFTHLTERVRCQLAEMEMLPVGANDAEVVYNFLFWLLTQKVKLERDLAEAKNYSQYKTGEVDRLESLLESSKGKTKVRLAQLEEKVEQLLRYTGLDE